MAAEYMQIDADDQEEDNEELQRQEEAFQRRYENEQTWDTLQEDENGNLFVDKTAEQRARRQRLLSAAQSARIRKGMIRYLVLVIDLSQAANALDLRPSRWGCMLALCKAFVKDFFDQNPLSQLGIAIMRNGLVEKLTDLSGTPKAQEGRLDAAKLGAPSGDASLQNALELGVSMLRTAPPYGHRELLLMFAALSTCDPGAIQDSIRACKEQHIRVSVVGVAAEVYVCRRIADETGGSYGVGLNEHHLETLIMAHSPPPPALSAQAKAQLVRMGFPQRSTADATGAVFVGAEPKLQPGSYTCPRCKCVRVLPPPHTGSRWGAALPVSHLRPDAHLLAPPGALISPPLPSATVLGGGASRSRSAGAAAAAACGTRKGGAKGGSGIRIPGPHAGRARGGGALLLWLHGAAAAGRARCSGRRGRRRGAALRPVPAGVLL